MTAGPSESANTGLPLPSRLYLPKLDRAPATIIEYLAARFPRMSEQVWRDRIARRTVRFDDGTPVRIDSRYRHGQTLLYRREVPGEPEPGAEPVILYQDDRILVADKPSGMVVSPTGDHLERALQVRLQRATGLIDLAPMHRLDRDTAGLVLFSVEPDTRGAYHQMFPERRITKEYLAVAYAGQVRPGQQWRVENRLETGKPWYRQQIGDGPVNAISDIRCLEQHEGRALFRIHPVTGKQHQIRIHLASIGCPIVGDTLYPEMRDRNAPDGPLQLLARRLAFTDPVTGQPRRFVSLQSLDWSGPQAQ